MTTNPEPNKSDQPELGYSAPKSETDNLPTKRPGAVAHPHLHRPDVHPLAAVAQLLTEEGFQSSAAEGIVDQVERYVHDVATGGEQFPPRNVAAIAATQAKPKAALTVVQGGLSEADVQARVDAAVKRATDETNAKLDALLQLVTGNAPKPAGVAGTPPPIDGEPPGGPPRPGEG